MIAVVAQLDLLDGKQIFKSERIQAQQMLPELEKDLDVQIEMARVEKEKKAHELQQQTPEDQKQAYSLENRRKMYMDMHSQKTEEDKKKNPEKYEEKKASSQFTAKGEMRQCNEGGYKWLLNEHDDWEYSTFTIEISKFLDTSLIETNLYPNFVSVRIKGNNFNLSLSRSFIKRFEY